MRVDLLRLSERQKRVFSVQLNSRVSKTDNYYKSLKKKNRLVKASAGDDRRLFAVILVQNDFYFSNW